MTEWITVVAEEYCDAVRDGTHDSPKQTAEGFKLVTSKHIRGGSLNLETAYYIGKDDYEAINKRSKVDQNDLLFSMIGTVGEVCRIESEPNFAIKNMGLFKISDELRSKYLYFYLQGNNAKEYIEGCKAGSTQQYMSLASLRGFPIKVPEDKNTMSGIVAVLDSLDRRIRINQKINDYLAA